jgi:hypothetical protein
MLPSTTTFASKYVTGSKTDVAGDFVKNRMVQLSFFLNQITKIPFLRTDSALLSFISITNDKEFKQVMETTTSTSTTSSTTAGVISSSKKLSIDDPNNNSINNNQGLELWKTLMNNFELNIDVERIIDDLKRQLDRLHSMFDSFQKECRNTGSKAVAFSASMNALADQFYTWNDLEIDLVDPQRNECINLYAVLLKSNLNAIVNGFNGWSHHISVKKIFIFLFLLFYILLFIIFFFIYFILL